MSGDRVGGLAFWDINRADPLKTLNAHAGGAVSKVVLYSDDRVNSLVLTAGQRDGKLNVFDMRTSQAVKSAAVHRGAINFLAVSQMNGNIVTGSADRELKVFDLRAGSGKQLSSVTSTQSTDAIFCGELADGGNLCLAGCGDGNIVAFDMARGAECLYGYGVDNVGAVHCMGITPDKKALVTGGDSG